MKSKPSSLASENKTLQAMISIYCRRNHGSEELCPECAGLEAYAIQRVVRCKFGEDKPNCSACAVHCSAPAMRERIRAVMRFSGPLMLKAHPVLALRHLVRGISRKPRPGGKT